MVCRQAQCQALDATTGFASLLRVCPRVVKWVSAGGSADCGDGGVQDQRSRSKTVPASMGPAYYATAPGYVGTPAMRSSIGRPPRSVCAIDLLESDNSLTPATLQNPADYKYLPSKASSLLARSKGFHPLIGNIAVGNPPATSTGGRDAQKVGAIVEAIMPPEPQTAAGKITGYTPRWDKTAGRREYYALRYRKLLAVIPRGQRAPFVFDRGRVRLRWRSEQQRVTAKRYPGAVCRWLPGSSASSPWTRASSA